MPRRSASTVIRAASGFQSVKPLTGPPDLGPGNLEHTFSQWSYVYIRIQAAVYAAASSFTATSAEQIITTPQAASATEVGTNWRAR
jgi:hypothetical protein